MFRLLGRKGGLLRQTRTNNLCDLLERIVYKGMFIPCDKYLIHRGMNLFYRTNTGANGNGGPTNNKLLKKW